MIIAVNTRFLIKPNLEGYGYFIKETFESIVKKHPEHQFYFLFDRPYDEEFIFTDNVHPVVLAPPARHAVLWKYWYDIKVPVLLRKIKADVFVSPDGLGSLTTGIPQCIVVHDIGIIHQPKFYKKSHVLFYKRYIPKFLKKATQIATVSQFSKQDLVRKYKVSPEKINVVYSAVKETFQPVPYEVKQATKDQYSGGKEYFIYAGAIHPRKNLVNLLKAFSIFKKRQQSSMKLVLAGRMAWKNDEFNQLLKTYKYREDVILTGYIEENELARLVASAYALVYPSLFEGFGVPVLEGMKWRVPALTSINSSMQEIAEDAGLFFDPADFQDIADKMMLIYKDENLRSRLIEKGKDVAAKYSWERTADLLWESILRTVNSR